MLRTDVAAEQAPPGKHAGSSSATAAADLPSREQPDPLLGMPVSGFVIRRKLAEGGMGAVYIAQHERLTNIHKVIKVLLPTYAQNADVRQRFEREAESASRLYHEHILRIDNFGSLPDGQLWLMTELLQGQPLDEFLRTRGRLDEHRALRVILQLCSALEHAHEAGIIHRDLKPGNVFVCPTNAQPLAIRLLDFGIAKILHTAERGASTQAGVPIGTPSYMAVEQYDRADEVTPRADVFSLAVMTCEMVTGRLPWGHADPAVLYHKQRTERPVLDGLSPGWQRVLQGALAARAEDRPESARAYARALAAETPAMPPHAPSGLEVLRAIAPDLMDRAAGHQTPRTPSDHGAIAPTSWSTLAPPQVGAQATTISAAAGAIVAEPPRRLARAKLVLAGLGACGLAGLVTFTLVRSLQGAPSRAAAAAPAAIASPQPSAASSSPADALVGDDASAAQPVATPDAVPHLPPVAPELAPPSTQPAVPTRGAAERAKPPVAPARPPQPTATDNAFDPDSPTGR